MHSAKFIDDFRELDVYKRLYKLMVRVHREILPKLPHEEKFNLTDQLRRSSQAIPALLAEGYAKRFQPRHWSKYFIDAVGEAQEMIHHLTVTRDLYSQFIPPILPTELIAEYSISIKQLVSLGSSFSSQHSK